MSGTLHPCDLLRVACKMLENQTTFVAGHQGQGQRHAA